jgi:hypothetical protein
MCAFLTATPGEEPKNGSTSSDGYGMFNRYGLFSNGVNRASSCIPGVALAGLGSVPLQSRTRETGP